MEVDHDIEKFWLNFKKSLYNFYDNINLNRPIDDWSCYLNKLQSQKAYLEIEQCIIKYISLFAIDLMRLHDSYNINILNTNIKRWDKISNKHKIFNKVENINSACNLIFVLFDIYVLLMEKDKLVKTMFDDLELFLFFKDFRILIEYSIDNISPSIIDKLLFYDKNILDQIIDIYKLENVSYPISAKKLLKLIK